MFHDYDYTYHANLYNNRQCITGQYATSLYYLLSTTGGVLWVVGGQAMVSGVFWGTVAIDHI